MENLDEEITGRVTRSLRKRLTSIDSDGSTSRPSTPVKSKLAVIPEQNDFNTPQKRGAKGVVKPTPTFSKTPVRKGTTTPEPTSGRRILRRNSLSYAEEHTPNVKGSMQQKSSNLDEVSPANDLQNKRLTRSMSKSPKTLQLSKPSPFPSSKYITKKDSKVLSEDLNEQSDTNENIIKEEDLNETPKSSSVKSNIPKSVKDNDSTKSPSEKINDESVTSEKQDTQIVETKSINIERSCDSSSEMKISSLTPKNKYKALSKAQLIDKNDSIPKNEEINVLKDAKTPEQIKSTQISSSETPDKSNSVVKTNNSKSVEFEKSFNDSFGVKISFPKTPRYEFKKSRLNMNLSNNSEANNNLINDDAINDEMRDESIRKNKYFNIKQYTPKAKILGELQTSTPTLLSSIAKNDLNSLGEFNSSKKNSSPLDFFKKLNQSIGTDKNEEDIKENVEEKVKSMTPKKSEESDESIGELSNTSMNTSKATIKPNTSLEKTEVKDVNEVNEDSSNQKSTSVTSKKSREIDQSFKFVSNILLESSVESIKSYTSFEKMEVDDICDGECNEEKSKSKRSEECEKSIEVIITTRINDTITPNSSSQKTTLFTDKFSPRKFDFAKSWSVGITGHADSRVKIDAIQSKSGNLSGCEMMSKSTDKKEIAAKKKHILSRSESALDNSTDILDEDNEDDILNPYIDNEAEECVTYESGDSMSEEERREIEENELIIDVQSLGSQDTDEEVDLDETEENESFVVTDDDDDDDQCEILSEFSEEKEDFDTTKKSKNTSYHRIQFNSGSSSEDEIIKKSSTLMNQFKKLLDDEFEEEQQNNLEKDIHKTATASQHVNQNNQKNDKDDTKLNLNEEKDSARENSDEEQSTPSGSIDDQKDSPRENSNEEQSTPSGSIDDQKDSPRENSDEEQSTPSGSIDDQKDSPQENSDEEQSTPSGSIDEEKDSPQENSDEEQSTPSGSIDEEKDSAQETEDNEKHMEQNPNDNNEDEDPLKLSPRCLAKESIGEKYSTQQKQKKNLEVFDSPKMKKFDKLSQKTQRSRSLQSTDITRVDIEYINKNEISKRRSLHDGQINFMKNDFFTPKTLNQKNKDKKGIEINPDNSMNYIDSLQFSSEDEDIETSNQDENETIKPNEKLNENSDSDDVNNESEQDNTDEDNDDNKQNVEEDEKAADETKNKINFEKIKTNRIVDEKETDKDPDNTLKSKIENKTDSKQNDVISVSSKSGTPDEAVCRSSFDSLEVFYPSSPKAKLSLGAFSNMIDKESNNIKSADSCVSSNVDDHNIDNRYATEIQNKKVKARKRKISLKDDDGDSQPSKRKRKMEQLEETDKHSDFLNLDLIKIEKLKAKANLEGKNEILAAASDALVKVRINYQKSLLQKKTLEKYNDTFTNGKKRRRPIDQDRDENIENVICDDKTNTEKPKLPLFLMLADDVQSSFASKCLPESVLNKIPEQMKKKHKPIKKGFHTAAGNIVEGNVTPQRKKIVKEFNVASGTVRVETVTPVKKNPLIGFRESPVTPFSVGSKVRQMLGRQDIPPAIKKGLSKFRKRKWNIKETTNTLPQPQWTNSTSGVFKEEVIIHECIKEDGGASTEFGVIKFKNENYKRARQVTAAAHVKTSQSEPLANIYDSALNFKQNSLNRKGIERVTSREVLSNKKRQQMYNKF